ncbi:hypothetical protein [Sphingobacterium spiritivorum]|uniref:hypothetical protein n=1 Tax=Sphingobacterium spiritivorum TaxID=258 RepID=UPI00191AC700|nr:hypothetical protein [Sphingobacterium spiritivorum]QQT25592.1 hypothetical protein I6J02_18015 [Sphingobacterium spiritivorum]
MKTILFAIPFVLLYSCNTGTENKKELSSGDTTTSVVSADTISKPVSDTKDLIWTGIPVKQLPFTDSTNFDNYKPVTKQNPELLKKLNLEKAIADATDFNINYSLPLSNNFQTVVITYHKGEMELCTSMLTVDKNTKIIDILPVAYDEVAESAFRKISVIEKDKITVDDWNYMQEEPTKETKKYILQENGKFKEVK